MQSSAGLFQPLTSCFTYPQLPSPLYTPVSLVAPDEQLQSVEKAGREPRATPARHCSAAEKLLVWSQEWWRLVVPGTACSHMAAPGAPWHSPQQILLVQLHPLSCLFDVGLALVQSQFHCKLSRSGCGCAPGALMARLQLKDGTLRLYLLSAQGSVW